MATISLHLTGPLAPGWPTIDVSGTLTLHGLRCCIARELCVADADIEPWHNECDLSDVRVRVAETGLQEGDCITVVASRRYEARRRLEAMGLGWGAADCFALLSSERYSVRKKPGVIKLMADSGLCLVTTRGQCGPLRSTTLLCAAAYLGLTSSVAAILPSVCANQADAWGDTALHLAAGQGHVEVAEELLFHGACVKQKNEKQNTPLHNAAGAKDAGVVRALLARGAAVDVRNICGVTPLHIAAERGCPHVIALLVENGAEVNATSRRGRTPLHLAAGGGHFAAVVKLLEKGSDAWARNGIGETPFDTAERSGHACVAGLLCLRAKR